MPHSFHTTLATKQNTGNDSNYPYTMCNPCEARTQTANSLHYQ